MSNLGQAALIVVGTVVGAYAGYPQLGFVLGSLAGSALFPTQLPPGPRLTDTRTTTSAVGGPVAIVFGTAAIAGTVMDLGPVVEIDNKGGKGGPVQETFSYTQTIAIGLCERVDDEADDAIGAISGLSRIWENGAIVYDIRPQLGNDTATGQVAETDAQYANRLAASAAYAETFTLYIGDELQLADPTLQALHGVDQTPAFRGLAYLVYPNRQLNVAQGLRHPNFQFEVFQFGTGSCVDTTIASNAVLNKWGGGSDPVPDGPMQFQVVSYGSALNAGYTPKYTTVFTDLDDALAEIANGISLAGGAFGNPHVGVPVSYVTAPTPHDGYTVSMGGPDVGVYDALRIELHYNPTAFVASAHDPGSPGGATYTFVEPYLIAGEPVHSDSIGAVNNSSNAGVFVAASTSGHPAATPGYDEFVSSGGGGPPDILLSLDRIVTATREPGPPPDPCAGLPPSPSPGYCINEDGNYMRGGSWTLDTSKQYKVLAIMESASVGGRTVMTQYPLNPCVAATDPNYSNATFWTDAYNAAVTAGTIPSGYTYGTQYPIIQNQGYIFDQSICTGSGGQVSIANIIQAICKRSGLAANQIDVKDLTDTFLDGYAIAQVCTGASIITPLRSIGFFDYVETGGLAKFATRGKPIVATFTTDDFGCYDASQGIDGQDNVNSTGASNCPPSITTARAQDEDLPSVVRFHYSAVSRDYEDGEQYSNFRLSTNATNPVDITVPVCLGDTQALQCASVLWADAWAARESFELSIDQSWTELDVGDCIAVPVDGFYMRMRIASDTNAGAVLRKLSCVEDDEGAYVSFAVAAPPQRQPSRLTFISPTSYELLDLPALQDADSSAGFYVAAQPSTDTGNAWNGAQMYKSVDGGVTFLAQFALMNAATIGTLESAVPASEYFYWDDVTAIIVNVADSSYSFESVTDDAVLAGLNAAAMGGDRRWEIVQFATATQLSPTQWQLTRLLRGRRGTEHVIGSSRAGDTFVMVSGGDLGRMPLDSTQIGASETYDGVSIGTGFATGTITPFTGHAMALMPFSPVDARAFVVSGSNIEISWTRRDRLGRTLMSGVDMPLSEATLAFQVDILEAHSPSSPPIVLRTIDTNSISCLYTYAEQVADFGSPPTSFKVAIYQMSAIVGRGIPLIETLTVGSSP